MLNRGRNVSANPGRVERRWTPRTRAGAEVLRRLSRAEVGGDHRNSDKYAFYFFDRDHEVIASGGGYDTLPDASAAVACFQVEAVLEELARWDADQEPNDD